MRRALAVLLAAAAVAACTDPAGVAEGVCVAVVNVGGSMYSPQGYVHADSVAPAVYLTVTRTTGCQDQGEPSVPVRHGESNYLDVGTTLHTITGYPATERLAVWLPLIGEWSVLRTYD